MNTIMIAGREYKFKGRIVLGIIAKVAQIEAQINAMGASWMESEQSLGKIKSLWHDSMLAIFENTDDGLEFDMLTREEVTEIRQGFLDAAGSKTKTQSAASTTSLDSSQTIQ